MGALSNCLTEVVEEHFKGKQNALAEQAGVSVSLISRYCAGTNRPDLDKLNKICSALKPELRARVAVAHLLDECPASARSWIRIESSTDEGHRFTERPPNDFGRLDRATRRAFEYLVGIALNNSDARDAIISTAKTIGAELD